MMPLGAAEITQSRFKLKQRVLFSNFPAVWAFVAVTNEGADPVTNVSVSITFWNNTGEIINQTTQNTVLQVILPNRTSPVLASITDTDAEKYGDTGRCEASIESYEVYPEGREPSLIINPLSTYLTDAGAYVAGTLMNNGTEPVQFAQVTAMFYDEQGFRCSESAQLAVQGNITQGGEYDFDISSFFATNSSEKMACVLTAESPKRTGQGAYEADQEVLIWLKGGPETEGDIFDFRWIVLVAVLIVVAVGGVAIIRRRREKTRRSKEPAKNPTVKAHTLKPTNFYSPTIMTLFRHADSACVGLRGLGCKVFGWSATILGTA
jgi:hypothetical protein